MDYDHWVLEITSEGNIKFRKGIHEILASTKTWTSLQAVIDQILPLVQEECRKQEEKINKDRYKHLKIELESLEKMGYGS
jgi:hypothetical protein